MGEELRFVACSSQQPKPKHWQRCDVHSCQHQLHGRQLFYWLRKAFGHAPSTFVDKGGWVRQHWPGVKQHQQHPREAAADQQQNTSTVACNQQQKHFFFLRFFLPPIVPLPPYPDDIFDWKGTACVCIAEGGADDRMPLYMSSPGWVP